LEPKQRLLWFGKQIEYIRRYQNDPERRKKDERVARRKQ